MGKALPNIGMEEAERLHDETRRIVGSYALDVVEGVGRMLDGRGSTIDAAYLVEIGCARLEVIEADGALRRGEDVDTRSVLGRVDDLLRRLEGSIVAGARASARCAFLGFGLAAHGLAMLNGVAAFDPFISDAFVSMLQTLSPFL